MDQKIKPVILSGGSGTRLWPLSSIERPKQLLALAGEESMLKMTARRLAESSLFTAPIVVCNRAQADVIERQLEPFGGARLILEPVGRNTAAAIALAALNSGPEELLLVLPSDHFIQNVEAFRDAMASAREFAEAGWIVTFGMKVDRPETGYGYIERGAPLGQGAFKVLRFVEKPDARLARAYVESGAFAWNAGMFMFRAERVVAELERHAPDILNAVRDSLAAGHNSDRRIEPETMTFERCPSQSFDSAVMERAGKVAVIAAELGWSDLGCWSALHDIASKDEKGCTTEGDVVALDCTDCLVRGIGMQMAVIGMKDVAVVASRDGVLIVPLALSQRVAELQVAERVGEPFNIRVGNPCTDLGPWEHVAEGLSQAAAVADEPAETGQPASAKAANAPLPEPASAPAAHDGNIALTRDIEPEEPELTGHHRAARPALSRLRYQIPLVIAVTAGIPALLFNKLGALQGPGSSFNTAIAVVSSSILALLLFRRLGTFPGVTSYGQVAPSVAVPFLVTLTTIFIGRIDYSRPLFLCGFAAAALLFSALWVFYRRRCAPVVYLLPGAALDVGDRAQVATLNQPKVDFAQNAIIAADLRADMSSKWEKFLLASALAGVPVYHSKQLQESYTGKVEVEHLSENTFGSVMPSMAYLKMKRGLDLLLALIVFPAVLALMTLVAAAIKLDSRGPVFYVQERMGFRGSSFRMIKFRTMHEAESGLEGIAAREAAKTRCQDERVTRVGRFLRHTRLDELPQIFNVMRGEMSWIGPRPEATLLSAWYHREIPYYGYRHIVRPGITGWAQVNQGHVVEVGDVKEKLYYDFYYIKYFSAWLDVLIALRTIRTVLLGSGAR